MNKQQLIDKLQFLQFSPECELTDWGEGYNRAIKKATELVKELNDQQTFDLETIKESGIFVGTNNANTPPHYQGTIQPIDLINAQDLNFNLGNVVKYVCRAGKKQGENILTDLEKAKDYINFEIERVKK